MSKHPILNHQNLSHYDLDSLCSIDIGKNYIEINLHRGLFDVPTVDRLLKKLDQYTHGKEYLAVINCEVSAKTTIKALRRMGKPDALSYAIAKAYVISTFHQKIMADIFLLLFRPKKPVKFFRDKASARIWLRELIITDGYVSA